MTEAKKAPKTHNFLHRLEAAGLQNRLIYIKRLRVVTVFAFSLAFLIGAFSTVPELILVAVVTGALVGWLSFDRFISLIAKLRQEKLAKQCEQVLKALTTLISNDSKTKDLFQLIVDMNLEPLSSEFEKGLHSLNRGNSIEATFSEMSHFIVIADFRIFAQTIALSHKISANLPNTLSVLNNFIEEQNAVKKQIELQSLWSKLISIFLIFSPFGVFLITILMSSSYYNYVLRNPIAIFILALLIIWEALGLWLLININTFDLGKLSIREDVPNTYLSTAIQNLKQLCKSALNRPLTIFGSFMLKVMPLLADRRTQKLLNESHYRQAGDLAAYTGMRLILTSIVVSAVIALAGKVQVNLIVCLMVVAAVWLFPNFILAKKSARIQNQIRQEIPAFLNLISICVQTGLSLSDSIPMVLKEPRQNCKVLSAEFSHVASQLTVSNDAPTNAFRNMALSTGCGELVTLGNVLFTLNDRKDSIGYLLQQQLTQNINGFRQRALKAMPIIILQMIAVVFIFIVPLLLFVLLAPAVTQYPSLAM